MSCPEDAVSIERSVPYGHVEALLAAMIRHLGFERLIASKHSIQTGRVLAMSMERLPHPAFKLATIRLWHNITLAERLDHGDTDEDDLYDAMDPMVVQVYPGNTTAPNTVTD